MSRLNKVISQKEKASLGERKPKKVKEIPVYDVSGKTITPEKKERERKIAIGLLSATAILSFVYMPQLFMSNGGNNIDNTSVSLDMSAIKTANNTLKNNPDEDFDNDGVINSEEDAQGTNPYFIDSDLDGITDYAELYVTKTSPVKADSGYLVDEQEELDATNDKSLSSPYKVGNVILWANDYNSKAYGSVVKTVTGYRFCGFSGYAQFPASDGQYVYKLENGVRSPLPYRETEEVYEIKAGDNVEIYQDELEMTVDISLFGLHIYAGDNIFTNVLDTILPNKGFIAAQKKARMDVEPDTRESVIIDIAKPDVDKANGTRFENNSNTLNDLNNLRSTIREDKACVAVSLFDSSEGEYLAIAYGYTYEGDILLADYDTGDPIGVLTITEQATKVINEDGRLVSYPSFRFQGLGFDSANGDRISFFATSTAASGNNFTQGVAEESETTTDTTTPAPETTDEDTTSSDDDNTSSSASSSGTNNRNEEPNMDDVAEPEE